MTPTPERGRRRALKHTPAAILQHAHSTLCACWWARQKSDSSDRCVARDGGSSQKGRGQGPKKEHFPSGGDEKDCRWPISQPTLRLQVTCKDEMHHRLRLSRFMTAKKKHSQPPGNHARVRLDSLHHRPLEMRNVEYLCW